MKITGCTVHRVTLDVDGGPIIDQAAVRVEADDTLETLAGKVHAADLHETDYTPWEGHDIFAWPVTTILRGKVMVEQGKYFGTPRDGRYLKRKVSPQTLKGAPL